MEIGAPVPYNSAKMKHQLRLPIAFAFLAFGLPLPIRPEAIARLSEPNSVPIHLPTVLAIGIAAIALIAALEGITIFFVLRGRKQLVAAESKYRTLAEQLPAVVYTISLVGSELRASYISPQFKAMLGYEPEEWTSEPNLWIRIIHPDDRDRIMKEWQAADAEGLPTTLQYRAIAADGGIVSIKNKFAYFADTAGRRSISGVFFDVTEDRQAQESTRLALAEKETLLKEVHHRVKNNFQIISSLLRLERERIPDESVGEVLIETERRIFAMALVHERLYQYGDLEHIEFQPYAKRMGGDLITAMQRSAPVSFSVEGDELSLGLDAAVPLGLFLNEALMNALKHAFPTRFEGERKILVRVTVSSEASVVEIVDTGIGFDTGKARVDAKAPVIRASLGLVLMNLLAEQLGGSLAIESKGGTSVRLTMTRPDIVKPVPIR
jgi:PAS domain S-box-containing protein